MERLDEWITGGRYDESLLDVTCPTCGEVTQVVAETEYGSTTWDREECAKCGAPFPEDVKSEPADDEREPPEREPDEDHLDRLAEREHEGRFDYGP